MTKIILSICGGGLIFAIINYLPPLYQEWFNKPESQTPSKYSEKYNQVLCPGVRYKEFNGIAYCRHKGKWVASEAYRWRIK